MSDQDTYDLAPEEPAQPAERPFTQARREPRKVLTCPNCKYDLRGSSFDRCPECGMQISQSVISRAEHNLFREVYLEPLIYLVGGLAFMGLISYFAGGVPYVIGMSILFGASAVAGWIIFFALSIFWIGFDQPIHVTMVRLAGAYATAFAVFSVMSLIPIFCFAIIIPGFVLVGLLMHLLEIDRLEAVLTAILSWAVVIALTFVL